jgi:alpha-galactosidase
LRDGSFAERLGHFDPRYLGDPKASPSGALERLPQEFPAYGQSDFRSPAIEVRNEDGSSIVDLRVHSWRIFSGKPRLDGLPATYVEDDTEADSLELTLRDDLTGLEAVLLYTAFRQMPAIARSVRLRNGGKAPLRIERILSFSADFKSRNWDILSLHGSWANERHCMRQPLVAGAIEIESTRGISSHQCSPFLALLRPEATETSGTAYGLSFVYSGNFLARVEPDSFGTTRVLMGINPFDFSWLLEPNETFQAPEVIAVHSTRGLGGLSRAYHDLYRTRLARGIHRDRERPILVNNWEATYFDFDADKIESIAKVAADCGIELFVLDDGWFGQRERDDSSLGDWFVNRTKLPLGLEDLSARIHRLGLKFGLWIEPEMVSPNSELYRSHADYCLHVPHRERTQFRNQLVLDLTRSDVRDQIVERICAILESAPIEYVKWDMNRPLTEMGSLGLPQVRQREVAHRYVLGVYDIMERITSRFPQVLFESCAGGGARFDAGILHYMPQCWTSDDMDAAERTKIQWGTSLVFPASSMGAHVCSSPNHITHRSASLETRGAVAMVGAFGYELDLTKLTDGERQMVKAQVAHFKTIRSLVQFGDYYRLLSPFDAARAAWCYVSRDRGEVFAVYVQIRGIPNPPVEVLALRGLDAQADYEILGQNVRLGGDYLMHVGLTIPALAGDLRSFTFRLRRTA